MAKNRLCYDLEMGMLIIRLAVLVILFVLVYKIYQHIMRNRSHQQMENQAKTADDMVQCAQCKVHLPKKSAVYSQDKWFCSQEHQQLYQQGRNDS